MKVIVFPNKYKLLFKRDVIEFPAIVDGKNVVCRLNLEEMNREFHCGTPGTFEDEFLRLRPEIEERAKMLIELKQADSE